MAPSRKRQKKRKGSLDQAGDGPAKPKRVTRKCSAGGCTNQAKVGGVCTRHGAKPKVKQCNVEGCANQAKVGGVCFRHGAELKRCNVEGCTKVAQNGGVCFRHGATSKRCSVDGCTNIVQRGGVCVRHGAKRKRCSVDGCTNQAQKGGVCERHGAKTKRCSNDGCPNIAVRDGVCVRHGAKRAPSKKCSNEGCTNNAVRDGVCTRHGAPRKKCSNDGCPNIAKKGGVCTRHGAKRKRCSVEGCPNIAVRDGVCHRHGAKGAPRKKCSFEGCTNIVVRGEVCKRHGAKSKRCSVEGCAKQAKGGHGGHCQRHSKITCKQQGCKYKPWTRGLCWRHYRKSSANGANSSQPIVSDGSGGDRGSDALDIPPQSNRVEVCSVGGVRAERYSKVSFVSLAGNVLEVVAKYLVLADVKALRLTSKSCNVIFAKDVSIVVSPLKSHQYRRFLQGDEITRWFNRPSIEFNGSSFIETCHRKRKLFEDTNCLSQVKSLSVSRPSSYRFLYLLGGVESLGRLQIYEGPVTYGRNGPKYPSFLKNIRHMELTKCAVSSPQTRLLGNAENITALKLRRCKPDIEPTDLDFFEVLSGLSKLEKFKFVPRSLICPLEMDGLDDDDDDEIARLADAEHVDVVERVDLADNHTLLSNRILNSVSSNQILKSLSMRNVELHEGVGIEPLRQLSCLEELCLSSLSSFEEYHLSLLSQVGKATLKKLTLVHCRLLEGQIHHLNNLERLEELSLIMVYLDETDFDSLAFLSKLKSLRIFGSLFGPVDLSNLQHLSELNHLSLQVCNRVHPRIASQLGQLESLESLDLRLEFTGSDEVDGAGAPRATRLITVSVDEESTFYPSVGSRSESDSDSDEDNDGQRFEVIVNHPLESLAGLTNLRSLVIYDTILTDGLVETICSSLGSLTELSLWHCNALSESSIAHLIQMQSLKKLLLHRFDAFTETSFELMVGLDSLQSLAFYICKNLASADIGQLGSLKSLRHLTICPHFEQSRLPSHIKLVKDETEGKAESRTRHLLRKIKNAGMF